MNLLPGVELVEHPPAIRFDCSDFEKLLALKPGQLVLLHFIKEGQDYTIPVKLTYAYFHSFKAEVVVNPNNSIVGLTAGELITFFSKDIWGIISLPK